MKNLQQFKVIINQLTKNVNGACRSTVGKALTRPSTELRVTAGILCSEGASSEQTKYIILYNYHTKLIKGKYEQINQTGCIDVNT